jgi:hypothetical protein
MRAKGLSRLKHWVAGVVAFSAVSECYATTIVTLVSSHGIVVCADGKELIGIGTSSPSEIPGRKVFVIQGRFVISHGGIRNFRVRERRDKTNRTRVAFSSDQVISEVQREASPMLTVAGVADMIRTKLISEFLNFDILPRSGSFRPEYIPAPHVIITELSVAGYDGQSPHVYEIAVEMDWAAHAHRVPPVRSQYPDQRKNLSLYITGSNSGILELLDHNSATFQAATATMPTEITALNQDRDLGVPGMVVLARGLVAIEVNRDPQHVGYPFTVVSVPKRGQITTQIYQR